MRSFKSLMAVLTMLVLSGVAASTAHAKSVTLPSGDVRINMPGAVERSTQDFEYSGGTASTEVYVSNEDGLVWIVMATELPRGADPGSLSDFATGFAESVGGEVVRTQSGEFDSGVAFEDALISDSNGNLYLTRVFMYHNQLVALGIGGSDLNGHAAEIDEFASSVRFN